MKILATPMTLTHLTRITHTLVRQIVMLQKKITRSNKNNQQCNEKLSAILPVNYTAEMSKGRDFCKLRRVGSGLLVSGQKSRNCHFVILKINVLLFHMHTSRACHVFKTF